MADGGFVQPALDNFSSYMWWQDKSSVATEKAGIRFAMGMWTAAKQTAEERWETSAQNPEVQAAAQAAFDRVGRSNALGGFYGLPLQSFDRGGWLPPGASLAWNGTGRPERVGPATIVVQVPKGLVQIDARYSADVDIEAASRITARVVEPAISKALKGVAGRITAHAGLT